MTRSALAILALTLIGCDQPPTPDVDLVTGRELELQVDALEQRADAVSAKLDERAKAGGAAAAPAGNPEREKEAYGVYQQMQKAMFEGELEQAEELLTKLKGFTDVPPAVQAAGQAGQEIQMLRQQKELIGKEVPALETEKWFVGETGLDDGKATVLVFWEVWCPHCKREVPKLQQTYDKYKADGLNMVALTQVNQGKTEDDVNAFIKEAAITYPVAKAPESVSEFYKVMGIPAAAVVKDGKVVWRGHPANLNDEMIQGWLKG